MTGSRLNGLPPPHPKYDVAKLCPRRLDIAKTARAGFPFHTGFETTQDAADEDERRIASLNRLLDSPVSAKGLIRPAQIRSLIGAIEAADHPDSPCLASSVYMRELRRSLTGASLKLLRSTGDNVRVATLISPKWVIDADLLLEFDLNKIFYDFRTALNNAAPENDSGFCIMSLHGEFEPSSARYFLHLHCLVGGHVLKKIEAMRGKGMFRSSVDIDTPIRVDRLNDPPEQISYLWKSYWPAKAARPADHPEGKWRQRYATRPKGPYHALYLYKLSRCNPSDLVKFYGCEATSKGIRLR